MSSRVPYAVRRAERERTALTAICRIDHPFGIADAHDSVGVTPADRARIERSTQSLPTPAAPIGDDLVDARVASAYRTTATVLTSASSSTSHASAGVVEVGEHGAAGSGPSATEVPWGSAASNATAADQPSGSPAPTRRSTHTRRRAGAGTPALQDNAG